MIPPHPVWDSVPRHVCVRGKGQQYPWNMVACRLTTHRTHWFQEGNLSSKGKPFPNRETFPQQGNLSSTGKPFLNRETFPQQGNLPQQISRISRISKISRISRIETTR